MFDVIKLNDGSKYARNVDTAERYHEVGINDSEAFILPDDVVVIDIDDIDVEIIEDMIDRFRITTMHSFTDEGAHFYYRKPAKYNHKAGGVCALGFNIEHKVKQCVITYDGITRDIYNDGVIKDLPHYFKLDKDYPDMLGKMDGENRYNDMLRLNGLLGNRVDKGDIMRFINDCIFEEPMDGQKLMGIIRSQLPNSTNDSKDEKRLSAINKMMELLEPVRYNGTMYFKDPEGGYDCDDVYLESILYSKIGDLGSSYVEEVKKQLLGRAKLFRDYEEFPIAFDNGYLQDGVFHPGVYDDFTPFNVPQLYIPTAEPNEQMMKFLNYITDEDESLIEYMFQAFGLALEVSPRYRNKNPRIHTFYGDGGNGKGFMMRLLGAALGKRNKTTVKIHKFKDKNDLLSMRGALYNIGEDVKGSVLDDDILSVVKNVAAADEITLRALYQGSENGIMIFPALYFTSNHHFPTHEKGASVTRRFFWVPFKQPLNEQEWLDDDFVDKLYSEDNIRWVVKKIIEGHISVRQEGFIKCEVVESETEEYNKDNNNVQIWIEEDEIDAYLHRPCRECYNEYKEWSTREGQFVAQLSDFKNTVSKHFGITTGSRKIKDPNLGKRISVEKFVPYPKKRGK